MESLTIYAGLLIVALRMTFGGAPCPNLWGVISETIADIGNTILHSSLWDHNSLFDPLSSQIELPSPLPDEIQFALAKELAVSLPENPAGYIDVYIDDNIGVTLDLGDNAIHLCRAIPLAIRTIARPLVDSDVIPRKDIISLKKFEAKGRLEEVKKILDWIINTRSLSISLPDDKFKAWSSDISKMILEKKVSHQLLESTIGRLNHVACIFAPMKHYMGRLYQALYRASSSNVFARLSCEESSDLETHLSFLAAAKRGLSLNNLVFRKPTMIYRSDASEFGIGGYSLVQDWPGGLSSL